MRPNSAMALARVEGCPFPWSARNNSVTLTVPSLREPENNVGVYVDKSLTPTNISEQFSEAAGSYNAALDLIHAALRAESEGERYTGLSGVGFSSLPLKGVQIIR